MAGHSCYWTGCELSTNGPYLGPARLLTCCLWAWKICLWVLRSVESMHGVKPQSAVLNSQLSITAAVTALPLGFACSSCLADRANLLVAGL